MNARVQRIELPGGAVIDARLTRSDGGYGEDDEDVGFLDGAAAKVERLQELIAGVGASVLEAAAATRPDEATVTFGIELAAKSGTALAVLASGETRASIQVSLVWRLAEQRERRDDPPGAPPGAAPGRDGGHGD
ncbi:CU044_2847 family protein [Streptomyces sp. NPDC057638]|uniref:CU044_2847 family protein n=1 Tax=Streptomyces sp. NPDC057638 TaxID=3346190 RepID=UPI00367571F5